MLILLLRYERAGTRKTTLNDATSGGTLIPASTLPTFTVQPSIQEIFLRQWNVVLEGFDAYGDCAIHAWGRQTLQSPALICGGGFYQILEY